MKKRALTGICIAAMLMALMGCGSKAPEPTVKEDIAETVEKVAEEEQEEAAPVEEEADEADADKEEPAKAEESGDEPEFSIGEIKDNTYENEYLNMRFTPLEGMEFASEDRLAQLSSVTADLFKDEEAVKKQLDSGSVILSCYASSDETKAPVKTFNVTMQTVNALQMLNADEETILDQATETIKNVFEQNGFTNVQISKEKMTFLGDEHAVMYLTAEKQGIGKLYEREVVVIQNGCVASYTASVVGAEEDISKDILDQVKEY